MREHLVKVTRGQWKLQEHKTSWFSLYTMCIIWIRILHKHWPWHPSRSTVHRRVTRHGVWAAAIGTVCRQGSRLHSRTAGQFPLRLVSQHQYPACPILLALPANQETRLQSANINLFTEVLEKAASQLSAKCISACIFILGLLGLRTDGSVDAWTSMLVSGLLFCA